MFSAPFAKLAQFQLFAVGSFEVATSVVVERLTLFALEAHEGVLGHGEFKVRSEKFGS